MTTSTYHLPAVVSPDLSIDLVTAGMLDEMGFGLDPWQRDAVSASAPWAGISTSRQQGKTYAALARAVCEAAVQGKTVLFAADSDLQAGHAQRITNELIEHIGITDRLVRQIRSGSTRRTEFGDGGRIVFVTRSGGAGRGMVADLLMVDEAQRFSRSALNSGIMVVVSRPGAQLLLLGTSPYPDEKSRRAAAGFAHVRSRALAGDSNCSWTEWSAPGARDSKGHLRDNDGLGDLLIDPSDPDLIAAANPAMPGRISMHQIERERRQLSIQTYYVERLNAGDWRRVDEPAR